MKTIKTNVLVIGGGPSGSTAARQLALGGEKVVLLEKNLKFQKPCGGGIFIDAFYEFDLPRSLITKEVKTIEIVSPDNDSVTVDISENPIGIVDRQQFDATLRELAQEAGAVLIEAKAQDITVIPDGVVVQAKTHEGSLLCIEADYLIAADGVNSRIRKILLSETPSRLLTYYADIVEKHSNVCRFFFGSDLSPGYYAWVFPHYRGINIGFMKNSKQHQIQQLYERLLTKASLEVKQIKPKAYYIPQWKPMTLYRDHVFYIGDSASLVMPFTYEGIYYALKSGSLAAQAILKNDPGLYEKKWNTLYLKKFKFLHLLQTIFLRNDWFALQMGRLYRHPQFQQAVIGYWRGSRKPSGMFITLWKVLKAFILYRKV